MKRFMSLLLPLALAACSPASPPGQPPAPTATAPAPGTAAAGSAAATGATSVAAPRTMADAAAVLGRYHWRLITATDADGQRIDALFANADKPLQLDFQDGHLGVSHTCNRMRGSYRGTHAKMTVGPLTQTMKACPDTRLMALDKAVGKVFQGSLDMTLQSDTDTPELTLVDARGDRLVFAGHPTAQTRYGSKGTTVFMEVAAQTVPCDHPPGQATQCLKVRERHFDANGLKVGKPGPWHPLQQPIEGYTHRPGVRNVLRLKRFERAAAPAGTASTAYVLDMVVESEVTR